MLTRLLLSVAAVASASPLLGKRSDPWTVRPFSLLIDYSDPITFPVAGSVFTAGAPGYVTWNATLPPGIALADVSQTARLVLGYTEAGSEGYHLDLANPLGTAIPLYQSPSNFSFIFPANLPSRSTYVLALMGSSGNLSPAFTINAVATAPAPSPTASSSVDSSSAAPAASTTADAILPVASPSSPATVDPATSIDAAVAVPAPTSTSTPESCAPATTVLPTTVVVAVAPSPSTTTVPTTPPAETASSTAARPSSTGTVGTAVATSAGEKFYASVGLSACVAASFLLL